MTAKYFKKKKIPLYSNHCDESGKEVDFCLMCMVGSNFQVSKKWGKICTFSSKKCLYMIVY